MGLFDIFRRSAAPPEVKTTIDLDNYRFLFWPTTAAGVKIDEATALEVTTVLACVRLLAQDVASLPLGVFQMDEKGRLEPQKGARAWRVLTRRPNRWQTAFEFKEMMTAHMELHGDAVAVKNTIGDEVDELIPLVPGQFTIRQERDWRIFYDVIGPNGEVAMQLPSERVFHLRNLSWNGYKGLNISRKAKEAIGLAAATEAAQGKQLNNGGKPHGLLTTDETLTDEQIDRIVKGWKAATSGANSFSTPLLDNGLKFQPISLNAVDQELIETRKRQVIEICAAFGVVPAVLGLDDKTQAFASVEAMQRWHLTHTLRPRLDRWEQALDRDVLDADGPLFARFDTREMTKATTKERAESYRNLIELGVMTRNEARELEGLPRLEGLDEPLTPLNMNGGSNENQTFGSAAGNQGNDGEQP